MRTIKRKESGIELIKGASRFWAEEVMAVDGGFPGAIDGIEGAFSERQSLGNEDRKVFLAGGKLPHQQFNLVLFVAIQRLELFWLDPLSVHAEEFVPFLDGPASDFGMKAFATAYERGEQIEAL